VKVIDDKERFDSEVRCIRQIWEFISRNSESDKRAENFYSFGYMEMSPLSSSSNSSSGCSSCSCSSSSSNSCSSKSPHYFSDKHIAIFQSIREGMTQVLKDVNPERLVLSKMSGTIFTAIPATNLD
jgi:hypothetical protein